MSEPRIPRVELRYPALVTLRSYNEASWAHSLSVSEARLLANNLLQKANEVERAQKQPMGATGVVIHKNAEIRPHTLLNIARIEIAADGLLTSFDREWKPCRYANSPYTNDVGFNLNDYTVTLSMPDSGT